ncbi:OTU deubiquitinase [Conglomerata obtusa]
MTSYASKILDITLHPYYNIHPYQQRFKSNNSTHFCYIKRDGNCFYNSFALAFINKFPSFGKKYLNVLMQVIEDVKSDLDGGMGSLMAFECFCDVFLEEIAKRSDSAEKASQDVDVLKNSNCNSCNHRNNKIKEKNIGEDIYKEKGNTNKFDIDKQSNNDNNNNLTQINNNVEQEKKANDLDRKNKIKIINSIENINDACRDGNTSLQIDGDVNKTNQFINDINNYNLFIEHNPSDEPMECLENITAFLKMLISTHIKKNREKYKHFVTDVDEYCKNRVDAFYIDASDIEICALAEVLDIGIKVIYLLQDNFVPCFGNEDRFVTLLFTASHFEPLFNFRNK